MEVTKKKEIIRSLMMLEEAKGQCFYSASEMHDMDKARQAGFIDGAAFVLDGFCPDAELLDALRMAIKFIECCPELANEERRPKGLERWKGLISDAEYRLSKPAKFPQDAFDCKVCGAHFQNFSDMYDHYDETHNHPTD